MNNNYLESTLLLKNYPKNGLKCFSYSGIVDHTVYIDCKKRLMYATERFAQRLNFKENRHTSLWSAYMQARPMIHIDDIDKLDKAMNAVAEGDTDKKLVLRISKDNDYVWMQCHIGVEAKDGIIQAFYFFAVELEQAIETIGIYSRQLEKQLRESNMFASLLVDGTTDYFFKIDFVNNTGKFSAELVKLLGMPGEDIDQPLQVLTAYISPEDRDVLQRCMLDFINGASNTVDVTFRIQTNTYGYIYVNMSGKGIHDDNGNPLMLAGKIRDLSLQQAYEGDAEAVSSMDPLTGLSNRYRLNGDLEIILADRTSCGALLLLDIDDFKKFNDMFGHSFGDKLILSISRRLISILPQAAQVYRFSGDEFAVLWRNIDAEQLEVKLNYLLDEIRRAWRLGADELYSTISMGIAFYPQDGDTSDKILKNADIALHAAKRKGKNRALFFSNRDEERGIRSYHMETQLMNSLKSNYRGFAVHYQPIVDGTTGEWVAAEALLRWRSEQMGDISPMEVVPQLERLGRMEETGRWILRQALNECARWRKATGRPLYVDVNLSAVQVEDSLVDYVMNALEESGLSPDALVLELTETTLMRNMDQAISVCTILRSKGVSVAIDDFGTGYSSFNYLRNLPVDIVKVERSFVQDLEQDKFNMLFINSINDLAHVMNLSHCVEGVETSSQVELLKSMKVDSMQGYYFGKPMPADVFLKELLTKEHGPGQAVNL